MCVLCFCVYVVEKQVRSELSSVCKYRYHCCLCYEIYELESAQVVIRLYECLMYYQHNGLVDLTLHNCIVSSACWEDISQYVQVCVMMCAISRACAHSDGNNCGCVGIKNAQYSGY